MKLQKDYSKIKQISEDLKLNEAYVVSKDFFDKKGFVIDNLPYGRWDFVVLGNDRCD